MISELTTMQQGSERKARGRNPQRLPAAPMKRESRTLPSSADAQQMPAAVQNKMERAFGMDFSTIRIFPDSPIADRAEARGFTQGNTLHLAPGYYQPETQRGQELLGHELAHTVQQNQGRVSPKVLDSGMPANTDRQLEREADVAGRQAALGLSVQGNNSAPHHRGAQRSHARSEVAQFNKQEDAERRARAEAESVFPCTQEEGDGILRPPQALYYKVNKGIVFHGMECNTVAMLYMFQSYGLIPPNMRLEEFEEAFTPIDPSKIFGVANPATKQIRINGVPQFYHGKPLVGTDVIGLVMRKLLHIDRAETSKRLSGGFGSPGFIPNVDVGRVVLQELLLAFKKLSSQPQYACLRQDAKIKHSETEKTSDKPRGHSREQARELIKDGQTHIVDFSEKVRQGVPPAYFHQGHTVYAGINEHYNRKASITHYVLLTGYFGKYDFDGDIYHIYSADDPFYGRIYVIAPFMDIREITDDTEHFYVNISKFAVVTFGGPDGEWRKIFPFANMALGAQDSGNHPESGPHRAPTNYRFRRVGRGPEVAPRTPQRRTDSGSHGGALVVAATESGRPADDGRFTPALIGELRRHPEQSLEQITDRMIASSLRHLHAAIGEDDHQQPTLARLGDSAPRDATGKQALFVANSNYRYANKLPNAAIDAKAMMGALTSRGYRSQGLKHDQTAPQLEDTFDRAIVEAPPGSERLLYYAGHGIEQGLAGIKVQPKLLTDIMPNGAISALTTLATRRGVFLTMILDTCSSGSVTDFVRAEHRNELASRDPGTTLQPLLQVEESCSKLKALLLAAQSTGTVQSLRRATQRRQTGAAAATRRGLIDESASEPRIEPVRARIWRESVRPALLPYIRTLARFGRPQPLPVVVTELGHMLQIIDRIAEEALQAAEDQLRRPAASSLPGRPANSPR